MQEKVDDWINQYSLGYWKPLAIMARLTEEIGELAREINHNFGPKKKKDSENVKNISDEISDVFFTLICMANSLDVDMNDAFEKTMEKISSRDKDRWEKKQ